MGLESWNGASFVVDTDNGSLQFVRRHTDLSSINNAFGCSMGPNT